MECTVSRDDLVRWAAYGYLTLTAEQRQSIVECLLDEQLEWPQPRCKCCEGEGKILGIVRCKHCNGTGIATKEKDDATCDNSGGCSCDLPRQSGGYD